MCALFQFVRHTPKYKASSFHEQYKNFCASKLIGKRHSTSINEAGQTNSNDYGDGEYSTDPSHVKNSSE